VCSLLFSPLNPGTCSVKKGHTTLARPLGASRNLRRVQASVFFPGTRRPPQCDKFRRAASRNVTLRRRGICLSRPALVVNFRHSGARITAKPICSVPPRSWARPSPGRGGIASHWAEKNGGVARRAGKQTQPDIPQPGTGNGRPQRATTPRINAPRRRKNRQVGSAKRTRLSNTPGGPRTQCGNARHPFRLRQKPGTVSKPRSIEDGPPGDAPIKFARSTPSSPAVRFSQ